MIRFVVYFFLISILLIGFGFSFLDKFEIQKEQILTKYQLETKTTSLFIQENLNRLCIAIFIAEKSGNKKWEGPAKRLFNALNSRAEFVNNSLSDKASDPGVFAETLLNLSKEEYKGREKFVKNLRLLPFSSRFLTQIEYWSAACFKDIPLDDWLTIIPKEFNENK